MLKISAILVFILIFAGINIYGQKAETKNADETMIREIVKQVEAGWNAKSGKDFAAPFAEDADYVVINGLHVRGKTAIEKGHQQIFDTIYKESHNIGTIKNIRFLRPDVAIVHVEWNLTYRFQGKENKGTAMNTMFLTKEYGKWSIAAFHNTAVTTENR